MATAFQHELAKPFWVFSNSFATRLSGGVLNYLLKPTRYERTNQTKIDLAKLNVDLFLRAVKEIVLNPVRSVEVYSLTDEYDGQEAPKNFKYIGWICTVVIATLITIILIALAAWNPFRKSRRRISKELADGTSRKPESITKTMRTYYRFLVVICPILLIFAFICFAITCYALAGVTSSLKTDNTDDDYGNRSSLKTNFETVSGAYKSVVEQLSQFLVNVVIEGLKLTGDAYIKVSVEYNPISSAATDTSTTRKTLTITLHIERNLRLKVY